MIHLDTNFLIAATVPASPADRQLRVWASSGESFGVSTIALAEYLCGPLDATAEAMARQMCPQPEPFLPADAALAATLFNKSGRRSRTLADCMIAAVTIRCDAKLATINTADFSVFHPFGLKLANI